MNPDALERLRAGGVDRLADLLLDDLLDRPLSELVDPAWFARQLASSLRSAAEDPQVERWFRDRVAHLRANVPAGRTNIPAAILGPLRNVLRRPYVPDRVLIGALLDHDTARLMLKTLFQDLLVAFAKKLRPPVTIRTPSAFGRLSNKLSEGVLGAVGHELEHQVEQRAREFTDAGVQRLVERMADHLCNGELVREYGEWRVHVLDVLLRTDRRALAGEVEKLDPEALIATGTAVVRAFVARPELPGELESVLRAVVEGAEGRSTRALLGAVSSGPAASGEQGIALVRDLMRQRARSVVETEAFARWWDEVVEGRSA